MKTRRLVTCPAADVVALRAALDAAGFGPDNFAVPLVPAGADGLAAPTAYLADWIATPGQWARLSGLFARHNAIGWASPALAGRGKLADLAARGVRVKPAEVPA